MGEGERIAHPAEFLVGDNSDIGLVGFHRFVFLLGFTSFTGGLASSAKTLETFPVTNADTMTAVKMLFVFMIDEVCGSDRIFIASSS